MVCSIPRPAPQDLFNRYRDMFSTEVLGGSPIIPESNEWYVVSLDYAMAEEFYSISEQAWKERDPRYACCDNLIDLAKPDGVFPRPATYAQGYVTITGTPGAALPDEIEIAAGSDKYFLESVLPNEMPESGTITGRFRAEAPGVASNITYVGGNIVANIVTPIPGVNSQVIINGGTFCGGQDAETCEQFRARYIYRKSYKPRLNDAALQELIRTWPCVTRICHRDGSCCTCEDECGCAGCNKSLKYYVFFDNTFDCGLPPQCVVDEMNLWLFGDRPGYGEGEVDIGVCGSLHTATAVPFDIRVSGFGCIDPSAKPEIEARLVDLFKTFCPSQLLSEEQIRFTVYQLIGTLTDFDVTITTTATEGFTKLFCGDFDMNCDFMPCLNSVSFAEDTSNAGTC